MFFLISSENPDNKCVILGGKVYLVGRRDCDILLSGDATVSRKHAEITVSHTEANLSNVNKLPILKLKDLSKFGTWVNSQRVQGERILHDGDTVYFGSPKSSFMVVLEPLVVTSSCLDQAVKKSVKQYMVALGGHLVSEWQQDCSLLIMSKISVTIKVICALVSQKYIVLPTYLDQHIKHLHGKAEKPDPSMFTPELAETQLDSDYVSFNPDIRRKTLFTGMKFYFLSEKQMKKMRFAIELAGGIPILLERGKVDSSITKSDSVVMSCTDTELSQSDDWISRVQSTLDKKNKHMILDAEIGYAVLYCSTEKHCNPDYVADEDLSKLPSQSLSQMEQFVPNTDTQNMTQGKQVDGKLKCESNTVIDETRYNIDTQRTQTPRSSRHKQMEESILETQSKKKERPSSPVPTPSSSRKRQRKVIEEDYDDDEFTSKRIKKEPITPSKSATTVNVGNKKSKEHVAEKEQTKSIKPSSGKAPTKSNEHNDDEIIWGSDDDIDYTKIDTDSVEEPQKKSTRQTRQISPAPEHSGTKSNVTESPKITTRQTRRTSPAPDNTGSKSRNVESPKKTTKRQSRKTSPAPDHAETSGSKSDRGRSRSRSPFSPKAKIKSEPISTPSPGSSKSKVVSHADVDIQDESTGNKTGRGRHRAHVEEQNEQEDVKPVVLPTTSNNPPVSEVPGFLSTRHPVKCHVKERGDEGYDEELPRGCVNVELVSLIVRRPQPVPEDSGDCPEGFTRWKGKLVRNFKKFRKSCHAGSQGLPNIIGGSDLVVHVAKRSHEIDDWFRDSVQVENEHNAEETRMQKLFDLQPGARRGR